MMIPEFDKTYGTRRLLEIIEKKRGGKPQSQRSHLRVVPKQVSIRTGAVHDRVRNIYDSILGTGMLEDALAGSGGRGTIYLYNDSKGNIDRFSGIGFRAFRTTREDDIMELSMGFAREVYND